MSDKESAKIRGGDKPGWRPAKSDHSARTAALFLFLALFLSVHAHSPALNPRKNLSQYILRSWLVEQDLPQNAALNILQTRDQYLWIGTQNGLARFDGVRFQVFDKSNTPEMRSSYITALYEDKDGRLWIGTEGGGLVRLESGRFTTYTTADGLPNNRVWSLAEDGRGVLWAGTGGGGLGFFKDGRFARFEAGPELAEALVRSLFLDRRQNLWAATSAGLCCINNGEAKLLTMKDGLSINSINCVVEDGRGTIWAGTNRGLNELAEGVVRIRTVRDGLPSDTIRSLICDGAGVLWIGTRGGLCRMKDGRFTSLTSKDGLTNDFVFSLFEDREGSLWVGTYKGLNQLKDGKLLCFSAKEGLSSPMTSAVFEDNAGTLWVGTLGGGINRLANGRFTAFTTKDGLSNDFVSSIAEDRENNLWVGTDRGLNRFKNGKWTAFTVKDGLADEAVYSLYLDRKGTLWIGTGTRLSAWDGQHFANFGDKDGLPGTPVTCLAEDQPGRLWAGSPPSGLFLKTNAPTPAFAAKEELAGDRINTLYCDRDGTLWIGTDGNGLKRIKDGAPASFAARDGLGTDYIFQILEDDTGFLWLSSYRGIFRVAKSDLEAFSGKKIPAISAVSFGTSDGMKDRECMGGSQPAGWKRRDGTLWFPTADGVVMIDPENLKSNPLPPPVLLESVSADSGPLLPVSSFHGAAASFAPGTKRFEFQYTALSFIVPEKVLFKYRLEGFDRDWIGAGSRRSATYTNLPAGKRLTLKVSACNNDGIWNETGDSFTFSIKPYFYQTAWFYGICILALVFTAAAIPHLRVRRLRRKKEELEDLVRRRTHDLEAEKEKSEGLLLNILPAELVRELKERGETTARRFDLATVVFADFKSFTTIASTLPAESLVGELNDIFSRFDGIVGSHGLEKIKTIGDAYMFAGGLPIETGSHALACIRAALDMQEFLAERNKTSAVKWLMRVGIHSGSVVAGVVGKRKFTYDLWGDTVNIASRLEEASESGGVNISAFTFSLVRDFVACEYRGKIDIKGKGEVDMYYVRQAAARNNGT